MEIDFAQRMRVLRVEQLLEMVHSRPEDGIIPEAIAAADAELRMRNVSPDDAAEIQSQILDRQQEDAAAPTKPLPNWAWVLYFLFGLTNFGIIALVVIFASGRRQMAKDAVQAICTGLVVSWLLILVIVAIAAIMG